MEAKEETHTSNNAPSPAKENAATKENEQQQRTSNSK